MELAPESTWRPIERETFRAWLEQFDQDASMGMAGGWTIHPVCWYLNDRDGGFWCMELTRNQVRLMDRHALSPCFYVQTDWLLDFCWRLKKPDAYRCVDVADCLAALSQVPEE